MVSEPIVLTQTNWFSFLQNCFVLLQIFSCNFIAFFFPTDFQSLFKKLFLIFRLIYSRSSRICFLFLQLLLHRTNWFSFMHKLIRITANLVCNFAAILRTVYICSSRICFWFLQWWLRHNFRSFSLQFPNSSPQSQLRWMLNWMMLTTWIGTSSCSCYWKAIVFLVLLMVPTHVLLLPLLNTVHILQVLLHQL